MKLKYFSFFALIITTFLWGTTFVIVKDALIECPSYQLITIRFSIAAILVIATLNKKIYSINPIEMKYGILCGILLFIGYAFQNFGLIITTPSKSAFITSVSIILVPIFLIFIKQVQIKKNMWLAILIAIIGLYLLLNPQQGQMNWGDLLTFGCAISFALHIIFQDITLRDNKKIKINILRFFLVQLIIVILLSIIFSTIYETMIFEFSTNLIRAFLITGIFATYIAFILMIWAQKHISSTQTALILSLEPIFAALFSTFYWGGDVLGLFGWIGGLLIVLGIIISEL